MVYHMHGSRNYMHVRKEPINATPTNPKSNTFFGHHEMNLNTYSSSTILHVLYGEASK
jgi:hypothetical protein